MTYRVSNDEILRLIESWDQLKPTLRHGPGELSPDIPANTRFIKRAEFESVKMVRFNPVTAAQLKTIGTSLSVAARERAIETAVIDAVAADPVAATSQDWGAADLQIGKLKIVCADPRDEPSQVWRTEAAPTELAKPSHNSDFTMINWFGTEYTFALGVQSLAIKALWEEWEKTGLGLHQDTIRNSIDAERDSFRMDTAFRKHPAFGRMIKKIGDGKYKLDPWLGGTTPASSKKKKSAGITSGARQKRV